MLSGIPSAPGVYEVQLRVREEAGKAFQSLTINGQ